jgi:hypothetical protein
LEKSIGDKLTILKKRVFFKNEFKKYLRKFDEESKLMQLYIVEEKK